jgi:antitoxin MazE
MTRILKWGNSLGLRIPKSFAKDLEIEPNSEVDITLREGQLIIRPLPRPEYTLGTILSEVTQDNLHDEVDFGGPTGREAF